MESTKAKKWHKPITKGQDQKRQCARPGRHCPPVTWAWVVGVAIWGKLTKEKSKGIVKGVLYQIILDRNGLKWGIGLRKLYEQREYWIRPLPGDASFNKWPKKDCLTNSIHSCSLPLLAAQFNGLLLFKLKEPFPSVVHGWSSTAHWSKDGDAITQLECPDN